MTNLLFDVCVWGGCVRACVRACVFVFVRVCLPAYAHVPAMCVFAGGRVYVCIYFGKRHPRAPTFLPTPSRHTHLALTDLDFPQLHWITKMHLFFFLGALLVV